MKKTLTTLIAVGAITASLHAAVITPGTVIGIDFGPDAPLPSTNFNATGGSFGGVDTDGGITAGTLIDTSGTTIDFVGFTWENAFFSNTGAADSTDLPGQPSIFDDTHLTDWLGENDGGDNLLLTFTGLNDSFTYDLVIGHGFIGNNNVTDTTYTVDGQSLTNNHGVGSEAYVSFTGLSTDGSGNLVISTGGNGPTLADFTAVAALQLTAAAAIPEPSSLAMLASLIGLTHIVFLRRRR